MFGVEAVTVVQQVSVARSYQSDASKLSVVKGTARGYAIASGRGCLSDRATCRRRRRHALFATHAELLARARHRFRPRCANAGLDPRLNLIGDPADGSCAEGDAFGK